MTESGCATLFPNNRIARQTFFVASVMVLAGLGLGVFESAWWLILALMPGIGMMVTAVTGFCPMSRVLMKMPWNSQK